MTNSTRKWIRGAIEILIHGGASAAVSALVGWKMSMTWAEWRTLVISGFIANGGIRFFQYFSNNPLPPDDSATISLNPLAKVQTPTPDPQKPLVPPAPGV